MTADNYNANVKIEGIPRSVWEEIERIATRMQLPKKIIVKMAIEEFAVRHRSATRFSETGQ